MKLYIHFKQMPTRGYIPKDPLRLHNVVSVRDNGVNSVTTRTYFSDEVVTHEHVDRVVVEPEREEV